MDNKLYKSFIDKINKILTSEETALSPPSPPPSPLPLLLLLLLLSLLLSFDYELELKLKLLLTSLLVIDKYWKIRLMKWV